MAFAAWGVGTALLVAALPAGAPVARRVRDRRVRNRARRAPTGRAPGT
ncbi:hypothetical protein [Kitasatospora indigofera]